MRGVVSEIEKKVLLTAQWVTAETSERITRGTVEPFAERVVERL